MQFEYNNNIIRRKASKIDVRQYRMQKRVEIVFAVKRRKLQYIGNVMGNYKL